MFILGVSAGPILSNTSGRVEYGEFARWCCSRSLCIVDRFYFVSFAVNGCSFFRLGSRPSTTFLVCSLDDAFNNGGDFLVGELVISEMTLRAAIAWPRIIGSLVFEPSRGSEVLTGDSRNMEGE